MKRYRFTRVSAVAAFGAAATLAVLPARAQPFSERESSSIDYAESTLTPSMTCEALADFTAADVVSIDAASMPAQDDVGGHCRVTGVIAPEIAFEVSLPDRWNGRFYMIGNGGHAGEALDGPGRAGQRRQALSLGFAFAQTNTGHYASREPGASFVLSNPQKAIDYAYRAVHVTAVTAKAVTERYFGRRPSYSYWNSCSNGGRQGLIEAQRFPEDFDGIVANAPWVDQTGFTIGAIWNHRALTQAPVTAAKMALVADRVMAVCDAVDGLQDGLIDDPRACDFDPSRDVPVCSAGSDSDQCLTPAQSDAIASVYGGVVSNGQNVFPGFMPGSEAVTDGLFGGGSGSGWMNVIVPQRPGGPTADFGLADNTMKYLVFTPPDPDWDFRDFDFDRDIPMLEAWGALANAKDPDLREFRDNGGKIIMTYGWADSILQPMMGVDYYESAVQKNGPGTTDFLRLFMIPGMAHCGGGIGPDSHDPMTAIIEWVENDTPPDTLLARKIDDGEVVRSRPLCPYPQVARYSGQGSIDEAQNFRCVAP